MKRDRLKSSLLTQKNIVLEIVMAMFFLTFTFVPTSYAFIRLMLFGLLFLMSFALTAGKVRCRKNSWIIIVVYATYSLLMAIVGVINNGGVQQIKTNVIYPVVFFLLFTMLLSVIRIERITQVLIICSVIVSVADLWVAFFNIGFISIEPTVLYEIDLDYIFNAGLETYYQYTSTHMVSHFFLAPFVTVLFLKSMSDRRIKYYLLIPIILEVICIYFSGRAALIISYIFSTFVGFFVVGIENRRKGKRIIKKSLLPRYVLIFMVLLVAVVFALLSKRLNIGGVFDYLISKIEGVYSGNKGNIIDTRSSQRIEYISGWLDSPLFGHGLGTGTPYFREGLWIDDKEIELTYISMLYQTGIVGVFLFASIVIYSMSGIIKKIKSGYISSVDGLPYLIGLIGILLGAEADPYLFTMGCIWMLYLPFSIAAASDVGLLRNYNVYKKDSLL